MEVFNNIIAFLDREGKDYTIIKHDAFYSTQEAAQAADVDLELGAKSMLFKNIGEYVLAVLPASERVSYKKLRNVLGSKRLRLATPEEVLETTSCEAGTCHPFGNLLSIRTICDESMNRSGSMVFNAGLRTESVSITCADYLEITNPIIADIKS